MAAFIKLTIGNGLAAWFNPTLIVQINEDGLGSQIFAAGDGPNANGVTVTESPDAILAAIADASGGAVDEVWTSEMWAAFDASMTSNDWYMDETELADNCRAAVCSALRARRQP